MVKLYDNGVYLLNGTDIVEDNQEVTSVLKSKLGDNIPKKEEAKKNTMAYRILELTIPLEIWKNFRLNLTSSLLTILHL